MNYMQDPPLPEAFAKLVGWLAAPQISQDCEKWVLVDGAVLGEQLTNQLIKSVRSGGAKNVFAGTEFSAYGKFSPHLIRLSHAYSAQSLLRSLLESSSSRPTFAILDASRDVAALCKTLQWIARASTEDGADMYCRFADTRITPILMTVLRTHQLSVLANCIDSWQIIDRLGHLYPVFVKPPSASVAPSGCPHTDQSVNSLIFSEHQYLSMMASCEPDEIFHMLSEGATDLVPELNLGAFHARLTNLVNAARGQGIESTSDIFQFCVIALSTRDEFFLDPSLANAWEKVRRRITSFSSVVESWSDDTWAAISRADPYHLTPTLGGGA